MRFRSFFLPLILLASVLHADTPIDQASFSELLSSDIAYAHAGEIPLVEAMLWQKYIKAAQDDTARKAQHDRRALTYGDKTMRFSLERRGIKAASGYPVYIALHGGGGAPSYVNDSQWEHMKVYYRDSVDNGLYIATRGVSDTWNLHFRDESYPLYDRLIENLIAYEGADPNRIYLLGFSAGGDGVYQITPRMPDRFAAANMSAGHHNWIRFDNLLNTPLLLQVGELDSAYNRHRVAAENFVTLNGLAARNGGYIHDLFIHANVGHNGWYDNDPRFGQHNVIRDPAAWLASNDQSETKKNTNAVQWLKGYQRQTLPLHVIWDIGTRSPRTQTWGAQYANNAPSVQGTRDLFYWLALDNANLESGRIEATIKREENAIYLNEVTGVSNFRILLHRTIFDFSRPVVVYLGQQKIAEVRPQAKLNVMARSLLERGDASLVFHDEIAIQIPSRVNFHTSQANTFSYCSDGRCSMMSAEHFRRVRNFPLDLNYTCKNDHQYALTFDDGPSANVPTIIEILARHNVKATFFVVGRNLISPEAQELLNALHNAGHQIANHSFTHRNLVALNDQEITEELTATQHAIINVLGDSPAVFTGSRIVRPPFGNIDPHVQNVVNSLGFYSVRWTSDRYDWKRAPREGSMIKERVKQHLDFIKEAGATASFNHSILDLNHDGSLATLSVLDEIIPMIKDAGYEFVTVSECLGL